MAAEVAAAVARGKAVPRGTRRVARRTRSARRRASGPPKTGADLGSGRRNDRKQAIIVAGLLKVKRVNVESKHEASGLD
jgi:hypothetical protein